VTIGVGTGDGRAVLETAARQPSTFVLGMDASAAGMAEASRRSARSVRKGGLANTMFVLAAAEAPPTVLAGVANAVTVLFPWGSLLRGVLGGDAAVAAGLDSLVAPDGSIELLLAPAPRDGLDGLPTATPAIVAATARTFAPFGFELVEGRRATDDEVRAAGSTWARRLGVAGRRGAVEDRSVTLVRLARTARG
jgi:16S rRNA (adenine(1408)-N(1))-methyltransferase